MTYFPAGETTGTAELEVYHASGSHSGNSRLQIMTFNMVRYKHIAVRFLVTVSKPNTFPEGGSNAHGRLDSSHTVLHAANWTNYQYHYLYRSHAGPWNYRNEKDAWGTSYGQSQTNIRLDPVGGLVYYPIGQFVEIDYDPNEAVVNNPLNVVMGGGASTEPTWYASVTAILYRKA